MNKIKENAHIKINQGKIPEDVIRELAITFLEGTRSFYSIQKCAKISLYQYKFLNVYLVRIAMQIVQFNRQTFPSTNELKGFL